MIKICKTCRSSCYFNFKTSHTSNVQVHPCIRISYTMTNTQTNNTTVLDRQKGWGLSFFSTSRRTNWFGGTPGTQCSWTERIPGASDRPKQHSFQNPQKEITQPSHAASLPIKSKVNCKEVIKYTFNILHLGTDILIWDNAKPRGSVWLWNSRSL